MTRIMRAAVIQDGVKINTILVDEDTAATYDPGYGDGLIIEGEEPPENRPAPPDRKGWRGLIAVKPPVDFEVGDRIDEKTGDVIKAERAASADESGGIGGK